MVLYKCELCCFESDKLTNYSRHLKTKKHLRKVENQKMIETETGSTKGSLKASKNQKGTIKDKINECEYCGKKFKHATSYYRHLKHRCKIKKKNIEDTFLINKLKKEIEEQMVEKLEQQKKEIDEQKKEMEEKTKEIEEKLKALEGKGGNMIYNDNKQLHLHLYNMRPKEFLTKYYPNQPSTLDLIDFTLQNYITYDDAYSIKKIEDQMIENPKTRIKYYAHSMNKIFLNLSDRLVKERNISDGYCNTSVFLSDGSMRKHLEKGKLEWKNISGEKNMKELMSIVTKQVIGKYKFNNHRPLLKEEEELAAKEILKLNDFGLSKDSLIDEVSKKNILILENDDSKKFII